MKKDEAYVKNTVDKVGAKLKEMKEEKNAVGDDPRELISKVMKESFMPKDWLKISDQQMEGTYAQAFNLYQTGKYKDAVQIFRMLIMMNPTESKYCFGLGACLHMMKQYDEAIQVYSSCALLEPENPVPYFHLSDCMICKDDPLSAVVALEMAIQRARNKIEYKVLNDRATITLDGLKKQLLEQKNKKNK